MMEENKGQKKTERVDKIDVPPIPETGHRAEIGYDPGVDVMEIVKATFADLLEPKRVEATVKEMQVIVASSGDIIKLFSSFVSKGLMIANEVSSLLEGKQGRAILPDDDVIAVRRIAGKFQEKK